MAIAASRAGAGLFRGLTGSLQAIQAKKERERRLRIMQQAATALQEYQRTGKAVDPQLAAEAASVGFQVPSEALRGFDPSALKAEGSKFVPTPAGGERRVPTELPTPESEAFEAGAVDFEQAFAAKQQRQADETVAQREAEAQIEANRVVGAYGQIPARQLQPSQLVELYDALIDTGQEGPAGTLLRDARTITKETGGGGTKKAQIMASPEWLAIEEAVDRGKNDMADFGAADKTRLITVFPDGNDRADFLGSGKGGKDIWKLGTAGIRSQIDIMFRHEMLYQQALQAWMTNDPGLKVNAQQLNFFEATHDRRTGEIKPDAIISYGRKRADILEKNLKRADVPTAVSDFVSNLVASYHKVYKNVPVSERPRPPYQDWQTELDARGITYDLGKVITLFEQALLEMEATEPTR